MNVWMIRGGRNDVFFDEARERSLAILSFFGTPDLSQVHDRSELREIVRKNYPEKPPATITRWTQEIVSFLWEIAEGDTIIMPYDNGRGFLIGKMQGPYRFTTELPINANHIRNVTWYSEIGRDELADGLWDKLKGRLTVAKLDGSIHEAFEQTGRSGALSEALEGQRRERERVVLSRSRNRHIVSKAWEANVARHEGLGCCEVCDFRHPLRGMFDVHHLDPIAMGGERNTSLDDLAVLCPRCHRQAHLSSEDVPHTVEQLKAMLRAADSNQR